MTCDPPPQPAEVGTAHSSPMPIHCRAAVRQTMRGVGC